MDGFSVQNHHFIGGVYCKEVLLKDDCEVMQHMHHYDHMSVLSSGCVVVDCDGDIQTYFAPAVIKIEAGKQHSVTAVNGDAVWLCIHAAEETDKDKIDDVLIKQPSMVKLNLNFDVTELTCQIESNPSLWNRYTMRTQLMPDSPHREVQDIWLRYRDWNEFDPENPGAFSDEHESVFYPAYYELPAAKGIIDAVMAKFPAHAKLGGCLITKIAPGKMVYPHSDAGAWHSEYYNRKILILLQSAPGQSFNFADEAHQGATGDCFAFDNSLVHSVTNDSGVDRISLILAIRDLPNE